jgi:multidrug resistance efflux pump
MGRSQPLLLAIVGQAASLSFETRGGPLRKTSPTSLYPDAGDNAVTRKIMFLLSLAALLAAVTTVQSQSPSAPRKLDIEAAFVSAIDEVKLPATETGMLKKINVKEGQSIDAATLVAEIDNRETIAKERVTKADLDAATAQAESTAELEVAQKAEEVSKEELNSFTEIRERNKGAVSISEWRKYKFQYEKAIAQVKQAINEREINRLTASSKLAQFEATAVEMDLRLLKSPFKGQVVEVYKKTGEWVQAGEAVMHLIGLDRVRVSGFVLARAASPTEVIGKPVSIIVHAAGEKKHTVKGIINFASPVIEGIGATHQFRVWAEVENEKTIDPVTKQESWKIQPGTMASMSIDMNPPKLEPAKTTTPNTKSSSTKVESLKPILPTTNTSKTKER